MSTITANSLKAKIIAAAEGEKQESLIVYFYSLQCLGYDNAMFTLCARQVANAGGIYEWLKLAGLSDSEVHFMRDKMFDIMEVYGTFINAVEDHRGTLDWPLLSDLYERIERGEDEDVLMASVVLKVSPESYFGNFGDVSELAEDHLYTYGLDSDNEDLEEYGNELLESGRYVMHNDYYFKTANFPPLDCE